MWSRYLSNADYWNMLIKSLKLFVIFLSFFILAAIILYTYFYLPKPTSASSIFTINRNVSINCCCSAANNFSRDFYPNIAVIVEFRTVDLLVSVVHNVNHHIPSTWPIQIFHGKDNLAFIKNSTLAPIFASGKIFLTLMTDVYGRERTNELLTDPKFWQRVRGEKILFFQIDSAMCSNSPHRISDYLQYDYVGAPWDPSWFSYSKVDLVGNGGFSLRSRNKTLTLLAVLPYDRRMPEDVWYGLNLRQVNGSVAPVNVAKTFSVESIYYDRPLGTHRFSLSCEIRDKLFQTCPEAMMIMPAICH